MYDCLSCGACCNVRPTYYILKRDRSDARDIPRNMQRDDLPLLKSIGNRCVAYCEGKCSIYKFRPAACRSFQVGGELCKEVRIAKGLSV